MTTTSVVIVDDHPLFRRGLSQLLHTRASLRLVGEAASGRDGIDLVKRLHPDLLLLDLNMRDLSGLDVLKAIKACDLETRVVMVTVSDQAEDLVAAPDLTPRQGKIGLIDGPGLGVELDLDAVERAAERYRKGGLL